MMAWAPERLIFANCGVRSVTPRSTNSSATTSTSLALAPNQSRTMREKSRPAVVFSLRRAIFFGLTCMATAAARERAMSLAVGLSWKTYWILFWAILSPILGGAGRQGTPGGGEKAPAHRDLLHGEGAGDHVEAHVALALVVVPDHADLHRLAAHLDGGPPPRRALRARLHLRPHVGADPGDGQEGPQPDLLLGRRRTGSAEERGHSEQERSDCDSDHRGLAHAHASAL